MKKLFYFLLISFIGCREMYNPPFESPATGYLVMEGVINSDDGNTDIILSRTSRLNEKAIRYEKGAKVEIVGEDNIPLSLSETIEGHYSADHLKVNKNQKYRLHIVTADNKEYVSDFAEVRNNPPIDSISWKREKGGIQLYISSHDPENKTHYYQWYYHETWEFHSPLPSFLKIDTIFSSQNPFFIAVEAVYKDPIHGAQDTSILKCWQYDSSTNLMLGSSAKLREDLIYLPLVFIPPASIKLSILYRIKIKQYSWTKEGYEFLERMKKNTEATGSLFDAQPSELTGNIRCVTDPTEPVVGFFNICNVEEKILFLSKSQILDWGYIQRCEPIEIVNISDSIKFYMQGRMPVYITRVLPDRTEFFLAASPLCVDCTLTGSNRKPDYWP